MRDMSDEVGLCVHCQYARKVENRRGSTFFMCERSMADARYPKYPHLPMAHCAGYVSQQDRR